MSGTSPLVGLTPVQEVVARAAQDRAQAEDAEARVVVWDAEKAIYDDPDAEGEEDPDYAVNKNVNDSGIGMMPGLLGIRSEDGIVVPIHLAKLEATKSTCGGGGDIDTNSTIHTDDIEEAQYAGTSEDVPLNAGALVRFFRITADYEADDAWTETYPPNCRPPSHTDPGTVGAYPASPTGCAYFFHCEGRCLVLASVKR